MKYLRVISFFLLAASAVSLGLLVVRGSGSTVASQTKDGPTHYSSLQAASDAFGFSMPTVGSPGWRFVGAYGSEPTKPASEGEFVFYAAFLQYEGPSGANLELSITPPGPMPELETEEIVLANGKEIAVARQGDRLAAFWEENGRFHTVNTTIGDSFTEEELYQVLSSLN